MANTVIPSYRVLLKSTEIASLIEVLTYHRSQFGLPDEAITGLAKLKVQHSKIENGVKVADYVPTGTKRVGVSLESLGGLSDQDNNIARNLTASSSNPPTKPAKLPAELTPDMEDELERANQAMLDSLAAEGNNNVVIEERRKHPRIPTPSGDALFAALTDTPISSGD